MKYFIITVLILASSILFACSKKQIQKPTDNFYKQDTVIMYSASWCFWCKRAKEFLVDNKIDYIEKDLESPKSYKELVQHAKSIGYKGDLNVVPLFIVRGKIILGFQPLEILNSLERKKGIMKTYSTSERINKLRGSSIFNK